MKKQFNYTSLAEPVTRRDLGRFVSKTTIFIIIGAMILGPVMILFVAPKIFETGLPIGLYIVPVFIVAAVAVMARYFYLTARQKVLVKRFADDNGLEFTHSQKQFQKTGMIFDQGHSRIITIEIGDNSVERPYALGNYTYTTGSGKNSQTHTYGYLSLTLPRQLPHMVLDAKSNNFMNRFSNLPNAFARDQVLSLEGDFNNYFTLYVPKQYERDALYVFTPDVMAHLIDHGREFDMEVIGNQLFIYSSTSFALHTQETLQKLFSIMAKIGEELGAQTDHYADERINNRAIDEVAPEGKKLKKGINWLVYIVIGIFILNFAAQSLIPILIQFLNR